MIRQRLGLVVVLLVCSGGVIGLSWLCDQPPLRHTIPFELWIVLFLGAVFAMGIVLPITLILLARLIWLGGAHYWRARRGNS